MARTIMNWNNDWDSCLKPAPGSRGSTGPLQISHFMDNSSNTGTYDFITHEVERFPGWASYKIVGKPPVNSSNGRLRSYAALDFPNVPGNGQGLSKYYYNGVFLGDPNNPKDWAHISAGNKNATLGTALAGFRYQNGKFNGPRGWLGLAPSGYPDIGGGGTIITPGNYLSNSTVGTAPLWKRYQWIDSIAHMVWGAKGTPYAGVAICEVWFKLSTASWANAYYSRSTLGVPTMYYNVSDYGGDANGASAYAWVGMYTGSGYFDLGDPSMTVYHSPWAVGDSFGEVDLPTELSGNTPGLPGMPTNLQTVIGVY
jgi:hypothetical protein